MLNSHRKGLVICSTSLHLFLSIFHRSTRSRVFDRCSGHNLTRSVVATLSHRYLRPLAQFEAKMILPCSHALIFTDPGPEVRLARLNRTESVHANNQLGDTGCRAVLEPITSEQIEIFAVVVEECRNLSVCVRCNSL